MAVDSKENRQNILGIARPWMRNTFPVALKDAEWRASIGNVYGGNALATPPVITITGRSHTPGWFRTFTTT